jgi:hypothetical protein
MHTLKAVASSTLSLPADNYIYSIVASAPGTFAAISSDDSLRVFDAADLDRGSVVSRATHDGGVTSLRSFAMGEAHLLATGGRDGKVKIWDARAGNGSPAVEMETGKFVSVKPFVVLAIVLFFLFFLSFFWGWVSCIYCLSGGVFGNLRDNRRVHSAFCCCLSRALLLGFGEFIVDARMVPVLRLSFCCFLSMRLC